MTMLETLLLAAIIGGTVTGGDSEAGASVSHARSRRTEIASLERDRQIAALADGAPKGVSASNWMTQQGIWQREIFEGRTDPATLPPVALFPRSSPNHRAQGLSMIYAGRPTGGWAAEEWPGRNDVRKAILNLYGSPLQTGWEQLSRRYFDVWMTSALLINRIANREHDREVAQATRAWIETMTYFGREFLVRRENGVPDVVVPGPRSWRDDWAAIAWGAIADGRMTRAPGVVDRVLLSSVFMYEDASEEKEVPRPAAARWAGPALRYPIERADFADGSWAAWMPDGVRGYDDLLLGVAVRPDGSIRTLIAEGTWGAEGHDGGSAEVDWDARTLTIRHPRNGRVETAELSRSPMVRYRRWEGTKVIELPTGAGATGAGLEADPSREPRSGPRRALVLYSGHRSRQGPQGPGGDP